MGVGEAPSRSGAEATVALPPDPAPLALQTLAYGLSGLIVPLMGMITLPVFARVFTRAQYGLVELGMTATTVAVAITDAGLTAAALRSFYDYRDDQEPERRNVMTTGFLATSALALALAALMIALRHDISRWLFGRADETTLVVVLAASLPGLNTWRYVSEVLRVRQQAFHYLVTTLLAASLTTGIGVAGVLAFDWRVNGIFFASLVGNAVAATYGLVIVRSALIGRFARDKLRTMLAYGLPLVPSALAAWALALVDRIILARVGSLSQVGEYAIANRLASLLIIGMTAFLFALTPFLLAIYSKDPAQEKAARGRTLTYLTFVLTLAGLVLTLFAKEIVHAVAPRFSDAYLAVGPLMLGTVAYGIAVVLTTGISIARRTGRLALLSLLAAGVNVALNFALIPPFGIVGAAVATAVGYGVLAGSFYWVSQSLYPTQYEPRKILTTLVLGSVLGVAGVLPLGPAWIALPIKILSVGLFVLGVRLSGVMTSAEFLELRKFVKGMIPVRLGRVAK